MRPTAEMTEEEAEAGPRRTPVPGVAVVHAAGEPCLRLLPVPREGRELGREEVGDDSVSRRHVHLAHDGRWAVRDLDSRNGTWLDGERVEGERVRAGARVLRLGRAVLLPLDDLGPLEPGVRAEGEVVIGPRLAAARAALAFAARAGDVVHLVGETGSGKELAAGAFHAAAGGGPLVPVNCAAIPEGLAERLLFGAVKGAYSGADRDTAGFIEAADGGTLFLDEVAELDLLVQAKLLRAIESREVTPLGGVRARRVRLRICSATHGDLRAAVADGAFREDLYFRIGRPAVRIPPLRERPEEIPWLLARAAGGLALQGPFVEACLLRPWPGNVRELLAEGRRAAEAARAAGRAAVSLADLDPAAGRPIREPPAARAELDRARVEAALVAHAGNVTAAARALGLHRTQLRRWLARHEVDPRRFAGGGAP